MVTLCVDVIFALDLRRAKDNNPHSIARKNILFHKDRYKACKKRVWPRQDPPIFGFWHTALDFETSMSRSEKMTKIMYDKNKAIFITYAYLAVKIHQRHDTASSCKNIALLLNAFFQINQKIEQKSFKNCFLLNFNGSKTKREDERFVRTKK